MGQARREADTPHPNWGAKLTSLTMSYTNISTCFFIGGQDRRRGCQGRCVPCLGLISVPSVVMCTPQALASNCRSQRRVYFELLEQ